MNLLIENLNSNLLNSANINVIKTLQGEFTREELEEQLVNFYYEKVIIDITAIKNYTDFDVLFSFLSYFEKSKVILFVDSNTSRECISKLVQNGYYNFTKNVGGIDYLTTNSNTLKDVEKYIIVNSFQDAISTGDGYSFNPFGNVSKDTTIANPNKTVQNDNQVVIGIENLTPHAGATTLMYMMVKELRKYYSVVGIEMVNQDHLYFRDPDICGSTSYDDLKFKIKSFNKKEAIIVDLNSIKANDLCDFVLFLVEPGIISLTKLLNNYQDYSRIMGDNARIVLNRSSIIDADLPSFEYETKLKVFHILGNLNERSSTNKPLDALLVKIGFEKFSSNGGLFGLFK